MSLTKKLSNFEDSKSALLLLVQDINDKDLNTKINESEWSLTQVLTHIIESEVGISKYLYKKSKDLSSLPSTTVTSWIKSKFLNRFLKSDKKRKAPKVVSNPPNDFTFEELTQKWDEARSRLVNTINNLPKSAHSKAIFKHPVVGYLNIKQTVEFMTYHIDHHVYQVERIKGELKK